MMLQVHPRLIVGLFGAVLTASMAACGGSAGRNVTQVGDDVVGSGVFFGPADSVTGDVILASRDVNFRGSAGGDYLGIAGSQDISGRIHGSVRAAGGEVHVTGVVDRNATVAGGNVALDSAGVIARNAYFTGGNVEIAGTVRGGLLASGGNVTINGVVGRDVKVLGGELHIGPRAQIAGNLRYKVSPKKVKIDPAARISGTVTALPVETQWGLGRWVWMLGFLLIGFAFVALFPRFSAEAAEILPRRPILTALVGLGWVCLAPIAIVLVGFTVIGLPLAVLTGVVYAVLLFLGDIPVGIWLGRRLLGIREGARLYGAVVNYLVGGLVLLIVMLIPVIGKVVLMISTTLGLGMILLQGWTAKRQHRA
ncbi:MAG: FapA family protein [Gemmatimonadota bacterium]|nr:FapA family protein [Gemmatimonadota bacterium]